MGTPTRSDAPVRFRRPAAKDGAPVWRLVRDSGVLDENSPYAYVMWCDYFAGASVVAEVEGELAGFVCGFRPSEEPDVLFVWQVAVAEAHRGRGLGGRMLAELVEREPRPRFVEATVTPSNTPSQKLFRSLAKRHGCPCEETPRYRAEHFPESGHEPENLFRIGPLDAPARAAEQDR